MDTLLQLLVSGTAMGFIYCLVAIEYTLIFNTSGLMNFGHDKYVMFGAYVFAGTFVLALGARPAMGLLGTLAIMAFLGTVIAIVVFNPLRHLPRLYSVMGTMALSMMLRELARFIWGPMPFTLPEFLGGIITIGTATLPKVYLYIIGTSVILLVLQNLLLTKTKVGKAMRAIAQDKQTASLMGINVSLLMTFTVVLSIMICGIIGILLIPLLGVNMQMSVTVGAKGFVAGVVGGFGSLNGAIVGGLFVGILESLYLAFGPAIYKDVVAFVLIILFLLVKPQGILGGKRGLM